MNAPSASLLEVQYNEKSHLILRIKWLNQIWLVIEDSNQ